MNEGHFYYLRDQYFEDFPDEKLMQNKEKVGDESHDRPCFYAFYDERTALFWMIPISSKTDKFREIQEKKIRRYGRCDTIVFGEVLGRERAFLIQNMCPVTPEYINNEYIDCVANRPVRVSGELEKELVDKAIKAIALQRKGINVIFPDVLYIERQLLLKKPE